MAETQISERQIKDQSITDAKVKAGAGIQTNKLADGANFIKKDGSVAYTSDQSMGGHKVTNVGDGVSSSDAINKGQLDAAIASINSIFDAKESCKVASTANVNISNPGTSTFDGVTVNNGERVLLKNQSSPAENGIYIFNGSGSAMTRATDMDDWDEVPGAFFAIEQGTVNADTIWLCTSNTGGTLDSTAINFQQIPTTAGLLNSNFVDRETPSGSINGSNSTFNLANTPVAGSEHLYLNGILQQPGASNDYTISGGTITMNTAPISGDVLLVSYRK